MTSTLNELQNAVVSYWSWYFSEAQRLTENEKEREREKGFFFFWAMAHPATVNMEQANNGLAKLATGRITVHNGASPGIMPA